jgi:AraC-like DNA-binding protein
VYEKSKLQFDGFIIPGENIMRGRGRERRAGGIRPFRPGAAATRGIVLAAGLIVLLLAGVGRTGQNLTARQLIENLKTKSYSGDPVELRFEDESLPEILLKFEEISGLKFKILRPLDPRKMRFTILGQPWDKALDTILSNNGLELRLEGGALVVDVFTPKKDRSVSAFLIGTITAAVLFGGLALERALRKRRRRNRDRERRITLDPEAAEETVQRLNYLFQVEKIYRNSRLSLNSLAERLSLQPYQLSGIINGRMGRTFTDLVADFRVAEVKKRLSDPGETSNILDIAFDAGFGTKAAFNRIFKDRTGLTPSEFKKRQSAAH